MKKLALIGSSGGNLYNLGGKNPKKLISEMRIQAKAANMQLTEVIFTGANTSMDNVNKDTKAKLYSISEDEIHSTAEDLLTSINELAIEKDRDLAKKIRDGEIDGVIYVSADPKNINKSSVEAVSEMGIPVTGTGGTAMANIQSSGAKVIAVSGTTGTTNRTRAISAISSFSKEFDMKYSPVIGEIESSEDQGSIISRINIRGIMMAALPGFISMALILAISKLPALEGLSSVFDLIIGALPIIVASVAAYQVSGLEEVGVVSGVISGVLSTDGGVIGGIIGGILAGVLANYLIKLAFKWNMPGTTANILAGGLSGLIAGLIVFYLISPVALFLGDGIRNVLQTAIDFNPILAGIVAGAVIWPAIMSGVYHAAILPIILLEMEASGVSFLGSIDMVALVMVSAGITLGNVLFPKRQEDRAIALPGFLINLIFGTFVEASYPFMLSNKWIFAGAIISGAIGGGVVGFFNVLGTAYVPTLVAPSLSTNLIGMLVAMLVALGLGLLFTFIGNKTKKTEGDI